MSLAFPRARTPSRRGAQIRVGLRLALCTLLLAGCSAGPRSAQPVSTTKELKMSKLPSISHAHTNRLAREKSPYLLQHQHNPVDWYAWGEEAFTKARAENKPLFVSIGYSTCHWCHVMERESFESEEVAAYLRQHFVSVKIDREERPDVDKIYMTFVQSTSGQGGWPLNVFLTPELKPFFGGTYFPPEPRHGRQSFLQLLQRIQEVWQSRRADIEVSAGQIVDQLAAMGRSVPDPNLPGVELLARAAGEFKQGYDSRHGGFGRAPKFPRPALPSLLLQQSVRSKDREGIEMVLRTCERMAAGGMNDQLGGGFARYSVDAMWLVPHFEKMLYDNAQLLELYLDAWLVSGDARHAQTAHAIARYVLRDMAHGEGGFYSAEDADSEGKEGKFYCWTLAELAALLDSSELNVVTRYYGITEKGNFVDHSDPHPLPNQNVLSVVDAELKPGEQGLVESARRKMLEARGKRVRPHLDDKVLVSWNGLMLSALSRAGVILGEKSYLDAANRNLAFLRGHLWDESSGTLYHRWRDGERDQVQLLDAYAFLLWGVIGFYECTLDDGQLGFAVRLAEGMIGRFFDAESGGFWQGDPKAADLIVKVKDEYDGAEPSGNSVAVLSLLKLAAITGRVDFKQAAGKTLRLFAPRLRDNPESVPLLLRAFAMAAEEPHRAVIAGGSGSPGGAALLKAVHSVYAPNKVVLSSLGNVEEFARTLPLKDGRAMAYVCRGTSCLPPTNVADEIRRALQP